MKRATLILSAIFLAGCAHFQPQPMAPEKTVAQWEARRLDDAGLRKFLEHNLGRELKNWPETNWGLPELTLAAFYFHPSLEVARAQWLVAQAGLKAAGARPNPSVTVTPGYDSQIPGNYSPWLVPLTFDLPIETAGKRGKRIAEAVSLEWASAYAGLLERIPRAERQRTIDALETLARLLESE